MHDPDLDEAVIAAWVTARRQHPVRGANALRQLLAAARYRAPVQPPAVPLLLLAGAGDRLVNDIVSQADREPGWVEYDITNPASGRIQTKMSYVVKVDDLYVGCGVYKSMVAA